MEERDRLAAYESAALKCLNCGAVPPGVSRFCLSCGKEIPAPKQVSVQQSIDPNPEGYSMLLFGLAFMMFFFEIALIFLGLWTGAALMMAGGHVLVLVSYPMLKSNRREIEKRQEEAAIRIKCRYCGHAKRSRSQSMRFLRGNTPTKKTPNEFLTSVEEPDRSI